MSISIELETLFKTDIHGPCRKCVREAQSFINEIMLKYESKLSSQAESFKAKFLKFYKTYAQLLETSNAMKEQLNGFQKENKTLKNQIFAYKRENNEYRQKSEDLDQTIEALENKIRVYEKTLQSEKEINKQLTDEVEALNHKIAERKFEKDRNMEIINKLELALNEQTKQCEKLKFELKEVESDRNSLINSHSIQTETLLSKISKFEKIEKTVNSYKKLETEYKTLAKQSNLQMSRNTELQKQLNKLQQELKTTTNDHENQQSEQLTAQQQLEVMMNQINLIKNKSSKLYAIAENKQSGSITESNDVNETASLVTATESFDTHHVQPVPNITEKHVRFADQ